MVYLGLMEANKLNPCEVGTKQILTPILVRTVYVD